MAWPWLSVIGRIFWLLLLPLTTLLGWLLVALGPILHLGNYLLSGMMLPLKLLAKFETLYIYLGVAALIGLVTGSLLHLSSTVLVSLFNLAPASEQRGQTVPSVRAAREQQKAWQSSSPKGGQATLRTNISVEKYAEWLEKDVGNRRDVRSLFGQTILEEDDNSENGF